MGAVDGPEELKERCVILKPLAAPSWKQIRGVSFIGFYAMPGLKSEAYRTEYLKRVDKAAYSLLEFVQKDVAGDALLKWETGERSMEEMVEMGATDDIDCTWAVIVGVNIDVLNDPSGEVSQSFGNAWIPLFSLMACYCEATPPPQIFEEIKHGSVPEEALVRSCCWTHICRVNNDLGSASSEYWSDLCRKRGYLQSRQNPRGF